MVYRKLVVIAVLAIYCLSSASSGLVTKCKSDDLECLKQSTQAFIPTFAAGLKEYNIKPLDPLNFKRIDASAPNLKLILTDITITGLRDCIAKNIKHDKANNQLFVTLMCSGKIEGQYEMDGQLLILPLTGKGPIHCTLNNLEISIVAEMGEINKNSVTYWDVKSWKHTFTLKDKSTVVFENLFDGNEVLAKAANDVISESGNDIIMEVGPAVLDIVINEVVKDVTKFFHSVPASELIID